MIDTPICELGFTGASIGASATGCRAVSDLMMGDFLWEAASQIVLQAGKLRYMSNGQVTVPMVVRAGMGAVKQTGPHHSGTYYPVWAHCPGLIVAVPSNPADAKGMFKTALRANEPVLFLEHKALMATKGPVPEGEYYVPFGQAKVVRAGSDLTIVSCGLFGCTARMEAAEQLAAEGISCEVIDLRTIVPLGRRYDRGQRQQDGPAVGGRRGLRRCAASGPNWRPWSMEHAFDDLDAPVGRLHIEPVSHPFSPSLEDAIVASAETIAAAARSVVEGRPPIPRRALNPCHAAAAAPALGGDGSAALAAAAKTQRESIAAAGGGQAGAHGGSPGGVPLVMPNMDLIITEATVVAWLKKPGDGVSQGRGRGGDRNRQGSHPGRIADRRRFGGNPRRVQATTVPLGQQLGTIRPD